MIPLLYLIMAVTLLGMSLLLLRRKTPFTSRRDENYGKMRANLRTLGVFLLVPAAISLFMAILLQLYSNPLPEALAAAYAAPLMSSPGRVLSAPPVPVVRIDPVEELRKQKELDAELAKLSNHLKDYPFDPVAYGDRGNIYAAKKEWILAQDDYRSALQINGKLAKAAFNFAEMDFAQKKYDEARPGFLALKSDPNLGDLAIYKVFLCDLLAGHEAAADKELDAFNQAGTEASYYFANIAWFLYHKKTDDARDWLDSAINIYEPYKIDLYSATLTELGYLPLPPKD